MHIIVFAAGTVQAGSAVTEALRQGELVIAADGGASTALALGYTPAIVVGDLDSLDQATRVELERAGSQIVQAQVEKDETDTELALDVAIQQGASRITLLGALGGTRFEHTIANLLLLTAYPDTPLELVDGNARGWLLRGPGEAQINGKAGDLLSLFPLQSSAEGVCTEGLYYPLHNEALRFGRPRGISNVLTGEQARVSLAGGLLMIVHTAI